MYGGSGDGGAWAAGRERPWRGDTYPHIQFAAIDGFDIRAILGLGLRFTKVYIDISGCRPLDDVMRMAAAHASALRPEVIVIKSTPLKRFVQRCVVWPAPGPVA